MNATACNFQMKIKLKTLLQIPHANLVSQNASIDFCQTMEL